MRQVVYCASAALALAAVACGREGKLYPVSGKVTYQGAPAVGAAVFFHRQGADALNEHLTMGIVGEDGTFEVVCGPLGKGAPAGDYDVTIEWKRGKSPGKGRPQLRIDRLQGRYADPRQVRLHVTVKPGRNELAAFEVGE